MFVPASSLAAPVAGANNGGWAAPILDAQPVWSMTLNRDPADGRAPAPRGLAPLCEPPCRTRWRETKSRYVMIKTTKGKKVKPANQNEVHQPVVGEAGPRVANLKALAKSFAPIVETRA